MTQNLNQCTGWIVCRNLTEIAVPDTGMLPRWAERGRIRPDDYLVNPALETCFQAKDVPELNAIFRKLRPQPLQAIWRSLTTWTSTAQVQS
jgi:hypothetical protein